jgi:hypothetical protein
LCRLSPSGSISPPTDTFKEKTGRTNHGIT